MCVYFFFSLSLYIYIYSALLRLRVDRRAPSALRIRCGRSCRWARNPLYRVRVALRPQARGATQHT